MLKTNFLVDSLKPPQFKQSSFKLSNQVTILLWFLLFYDLGLAEWSNWYVIGLILGYYTQLKTALQRASTTKSVTSA